jgi:hypothetical protein
MLLKGFIHFHLILVVCSTQRKIYTEHTFKHLRVIVAQAVSRWLPTAAARIRIRSACGVCGGQSGTGAGFLRNTSVSPASHHSTKFSVIIITWSWYSRPISGRSAEWTQLSPSPTIQIKKRNANRSNIQ